MAGSRVHRGHRWLTRNPSSLVLELVLPPSPQPDQDPRGRRLTELDELARRVLAACTQSQNDPLGMFPSERELARNLGVSRHAVRGAIDYLEQRGAVRRLPGRGALVVSRQSGNPADQATRPVASLRCINFLLGPSLSQTPLQWLMYEYIAGYNDVLDLLDIKTRFVYWADDRRDFEAMFWPQAPRGEQACVLLNRRDPALLRWLAEQHVPFVVQNHAAYDDTSLPPHHRVYINKIGGAFEATRHLLDLGHRHIGYVGGLPDPQALTPEHEGWMSALRCAGLTPPPEHTLSLSTEELDVAVSPCREFLSRAGRPTAIVAANGAALTGLQVAAELLGLRVPQDLSIIGFTSPLTIHRNRLSTIEVPRRELGKAAVELVLKLAQGEIDRDSPRRIVLNCTLNLRSSTARLGS